MEGCFVHTLRGAWPCAPTHPATGTGSRFPPARERRVLQPGARSWCTLHSDADNPAKPASRQQSRQTSVPPNQRPAKPAPNSRPQSCTPETSYMSAIQTWNEMVRLEHEQSDRIRGLATHRLLGDCRPEFQAGPVPHRRWSRRGAAFPPGPGRDPAGRRGRRRPAGAAPGPYLQRRCRRRTLAQHVRRFPRNRRRKRHSERVGQLSPTG